MVAAAFAVAFAVAALGGVLTDTGPWYQSLRQPWWKPPDWLFGPAWTLIFTCIALSGAFAWHGVPPLARWQVFGMYAVNALLNVVWSFFFFTAKRPDWALFEVLWLWLSIALLVRMLWAHSRPAAWLLLPYLVWVAFAAMLNLAVVQLNPQLGTAR